MNRPLETVDSRELREELDRLGLEVDELRASRERLVLASDTDRRRIERGLHDGPHQHLIALAVNLQLARQLVDSDPDAAKALLDGMARDVQVALDDTARLAQRIHPPLLEARGLGAALRAAAAHVRAPVSIDVEAADDYPPEVVSTLYLCCLEAIENIGGESAVTIRAEEDKLTFEIAAVGKRPVLELDRLRDRVEALGGRLTIDDETDGGTRVAGSLPRSR